jgi:uncharacterized protein (TIGR02271 family)
MQIQTKPTRRLSQYEQVYTDKDLPWEQASPAARDAYIRLYEERLVVNKSRVKAGEVSIGKHVETEVAKVAVPIDKELVVVERVASGSERAVDFSEAQFAEGEVARVEVYEETPEICK